MKDLNIGTMVKYDEYFDTCRGKTKARNLIVLKKRNGAGNSGATHQKTLRTQRELYGKGSKRQRARSRSRSR